MKHIKNIFRILAVTCIALPLELSAYIVVPLILLFVGKDDKRLPRAFRWYDDWKYGIDGDEYWVNPNQKDKPPTKEAAQTYKWRLKWLLRNKATTFMHEIVGVRLLPKGKIIQYGDDETEDQPVGHSGFQYIEYHYDGKMWPCYYWVRQWGSTGRCIRFYCGWKLKGYWPDLKKGIQGRPYAMFSNLTPPNPLKGFAKQDK